MISKHQQGRSDPEIFQAEEINVENDNVDTRYIRVYMYIKKVKQVCNIIFFHKFKTITENKKRDRFISVEFCLSNI